MDVQPTVSLCLTIPMDEEIQAESFGGYCYHNDLDATRVYGTAYTEPEYLGLSDSIARVSLNSSTNSQTIENIVPTSSPYANSYVLTSSHSSYASDAYSDAPVSTAPIPASQSTGYEAGGYSTGTGSSSIPSSGTQSPALYIDPYASETSASATSTYSIDPSTRPKVATNQVQATNLPFRVETPPTPAVDWVKAFYSVQSKITQSGQNLDTIEVMDLMSEMTSKFTEDAIAYGTIIIQEKNIPFQQKSIKPVDVGGIAGGLKFVHAGIFFKFAVDERDLYGSQERAMKGAGHEMKGLTALINWELKTIGLHTIKFPLTAIIDYYGYRLVATAVLPLSSKTLVIGSGDAGVTILDGSESGKPSCLNLSSYLKDFAKFLNLSHHIMENRGTKKRVKVSICFDLEGHIGTDGNSYLCDFARVFPPVDTKNVKGSFLFRMMRPEFVKKYRVPLSSDSFMSMAVEKNLNAVTREASHYLSTKWLISAVKLLNKMNCVLPANILAILIHQHGINFRYLRLVSSIIEDEKLRKVVNAEIVARTLKSVIRRDIRDAQWVTDLDIHDITFKYFNLVFSHSKESEEYWHKKLQLEILERFLPPTSAFLDLAASTPLETPNSTPIPSPFSTPDGTPNQSLEMKQGEEDYSFQNSPTSSYSAKSRGKKASIKKSSAKKSSSATSRSPSAASSKKSKSKKGSSQSNRTSEASQFMVIDDDNGDEGDSRLSNRPRRSTRTRRAPANRRPVPAYDPDEDENDADFVPGNDGNLSNDDDMDFEEDDDGEFAGLTSVQRAERELAEHYKVGYGYSPSQSQEEEKSNPYTDVDPYSTPVSTNTNNSNRSQLKSSNNSTKTRSSSSANAETTFTNNLQLNPTVIQGSEVKYGQKAITPVQSPQKAQAPANSTPLAPITPGFELTKSNNRSSNLIPSTPTGQSQHSGESISQLSTPSQSSTPSLSSSSQTEELKSSGIISNPEYPTMKVCREIGILKSMVDLDSLFFRLQKLIGFELKTSASLKLKSVLDHMELNPSNPQTAINSENPETPEFSEMHLGLDESDFEAYKPRIKQMFLTPFQNGFRFKTCADQTEDFDEREKFLNLSLEAYLECLERNPLGDFALHNCARVLHALIPFYSRSCNELDCMQYLSKRFAALAIAQNDRLSKFHADIYRSSELVEARTGRVISKRAPEWCQENWFRRIVVLKSELAEIVMGCTLDAGFDSETLSILLRESYSQLFNEFVGKDNRVTRKIALQCWKMFASVLTPSNAEGLQSIMDQLREIPNEASAHITRDHWQMVSNLLFGEIQD